MRVLQVIWDGGGNVPMQLLVTRELVSRGHEVRVLGHRCQRERVEATGAGFVPYVHAPDGDASNPETDLIRDWEARTPLGAFARTRDNLMFGPALEFARDVVAELERNPADVVACDYLIGGGAIGAEAAGVPAALVIHTVYPLPVPGVPPFGQGLMPAGGLPGRVRDAVIARGFRASFRPGLKPVNAARRELGLEPQDDIFDLFDRAALGLVLTSPEFDFAGHAALPAHVRYVGPVTDRGEGGSWDSPWPAGDRRPLVIASFSTSFQDQRDLASNVLSALGELPVRGLLTTGPALDVSGLEVPENIEVREFVSHAAVLPEADLMITHAGLGTVHATLSAGVPMVCIPDGRDQNDNAARVVAAGAGRRLRRSVGARRLRATVSEVLDDDSLRRGAERLAVAFREQDGAAATVDALEELAG